MKIDIRMSGTGAEQELRSLYQWLLAEPQARQHADVRSVEPEQAAGEMGGGIFDIIQLTITSGFSLADLALNYATWRGTRQSPVVVTMESGKHKITLSADDPETLQDLIRSLEAGRSKPE